VIEPKRVSEISLRPAAGFHGELAGVDLAALLQVTCARRERSVLRVRSGAREGFIYLAEGRVVHAMLGFITGEPALVQMLGFSTGEFHACERPWPARDTIQDSLEIILMRAAQREGERGRSSDTGVVERPSPKKATLLPMSIPPSPTGALSGLACTGEGPLIASVRIDMNGELVSQHGPVDTLAPLVAYVTRVGALLGSQLGLRAFEALSADLGGQKVLIFVEGDEMVGLLLSPGAMCAEIRQSLGV
jgi:hypothetical protein